MRTNKELRRLARENLTGNYKVPMGAVVMSQLIASLLSFPFVEMLPDHPSPGQDLVYYIASFLIALLTGVLGVGELKIHMNLIRDEQYGLGLLFYGFKNRPDRYIVGSFISIVLTGVWMLPAAFVSYEVYRDYSLDKAMIALGLGVAGLVVSVIFYLNMAVFMYLLMDYPNATIMECFKHSFEIMKGYKGRFFALSFGFIGLVLLSILSFGIGLFWVLPYMNQTYTLFYFELKGELSSIIEKRNASTGYTFNQYV